MRSYEAEEIDELFREGVVHGYLENEDEFEEGYSRDNYSNYEIGNHLDIYFRFFGLKDMDIIYLYFLSGKKQHELMEILQKTQPAISYDVNRIREQIEYVMTIVNKLDDFILFIVDEENKLTIAERELLLVFFYSTSIVKTSKILNQHHITCRTRINNAIEKINTMGNAEMYNFFKYILVNLNSIKKDISAE